MAFPAFGKGSTIVKMAATHKITSSLFINTLVLCLFDTCMNTNIISWSSIMKCWEKLRGESGIWGRVGVIFSQAFNMRFDSYKYVFKTSIMRDIKRRRSGRGKAWIWRCQCHLLSSNGPPPSKTHYL